MAKFIFLITRGIEDPVRVTRSLQLARVAKEKGHDVDIFLTDDAVYLAKEGMIDSVVAPTGDQALDHFGYLISQNVPIHLCTPCAEFRKVREEELVETAKYGKAPDLIEMSIEATVFTF